MNISSCNKQGGAAEHDNDGEAHPQHHVDLAPAQPQPADLGKAGGDRDRSGDIDPLQLEGDEEQDDRKQIEQKFHGRGL